ncbi:MAG: hypothetical protein KAH54_03885 [Candidatus Sabulitectum sp.]|nr:hypothetical protein [Candidatus Sabulitectum sp.]
MERNSYREIIQYQLTRYPGMQLQDLYKLIYQGVLGSSHAINSVDAAEKWLSDELLFMGTDSFGEEVVEKLSSHIARVNLRPFVADGGDPALLLQSFIWTGREYSGSTVDLIRTWDMAGEIQDLFQLSKMKSFIHRQEAEGFPAVHHSSIYRELYRPAYRVVCIKELKCLSCE